MMFRFTASRFSKWLLLFICLENMRSSTEADSGLRKAGTDSLLDPICTQSKTEDRFYSVEASTGSCYRYFKKANYSKATERCRFLGLDLASTASEEALPEGIVDKMKTSRSAYHWSTECGRRQNNCHAVKDTNASCSASYVSRDVEQNEDITCTSKLPYICTRRAAIIDHLHADTYWEARKRCKKDFDLNLISPQTVDEWKSTMTLIRTKWPHEDDERRTPVSIWIGLHIINGTFYWNHGSEMTPTKLKDLPFPVQGIQNTGKGRYFAVIEWNNGEFNVVMQSRSAEAYYICGKVPYIKAKPTQPTTSTANTTIASNRSEPVWPYLLCTAIVLLVGAIIFAVLYFRKLQRKRRQNGTISNMIPVSYTNTQKGNPGGCPHLQNAHPRSTSTSTPCSALYLEVDSTAVLPPKKPPRKRTTVRGTGPIPAIGIYMPAQEGMASSVDDISLASAYETPFPRESPVYMSLNEKTVPKGCAETPTRDRTPQNNPSSFQATSEIHKSVVGRRPTETYPKEAGVIRAGAEGLNERCRATADVCLADESIEQDSAHVYECIEHLNPADAKNMPHATEANNKKDKNNVHEKTTDTDVSTRTYKVPMETRHKNVAMEMADSDNANDMADCTHDGAGDYTDPHQYAEIGAYENFTFNPPSG